MKEAEYLDLMSPEIFWRNVGPPEGELGCRLWQSVKWTNGYGLWRVKIAGRYVKFRAHRVAYLFAGGMDGKQVNHHCDVSIVLRGYPPLPGHSGGERSGLGESG